MTNSFNITSLLQSVDQLGQNLRNAFPQAGWGQGMRFRGNEPLPLEGMSGLLDELGDIDALENLLRNATSPGPLAEVDSAKVRGRLRDDAARQSPPRPVLAAPPASGPPRRRRAGAAASWMPPDLPVWASRLVAGGPAPKRMFRPTWNFLPAFSAASTISLPNLLLMAIGFSQMTCLPAANASMTGGACM